MPRLAFVVGCLLLCSAVLPADEGVPAGTLTRCNEVRSLSRQEANRGLPVSVRGVVTYLGTGDDGLQSFTLDDGVGIWVRPGLPDGPAQQRSNLAVGDFVEVLGRSHMGLFAPIIIIDSMTVLGTRPLPAAEPVATAGLALARYDCQRVEINGVVEWAENVSAGDQGSALRMKVSTPSGRFNSILTGQTAHSAPDLIDSEVTVTGVLLTQRNERRQFTGEVTLRGVAAEGLRVRRAAPYAAFDAPWVTLREVMTFSPAGPNLHRQRVLGVVTLAVPGSYFFLQDEEGASLKVNTRQPDRIQPGKTVEASGFFHLDDERAEMFEARFHEVDQVMTVESLTTTASELVSWTGRDVFSQEPDYDGRLVSLRGRLLALNWPSKEMPRLMLETEGSLVPVDFSTPGDFSWVSNLRLGSELGLTGICSLNPIEGSGFETQTRRSLSLLLQGPEDIRLIKAASWWTQGRLLTALAITSALLLFFLGWSALLRRAVEVKGAKLANEMRARRDAAIEFESTLRERNRLAADLHDSTEQALTGLAMQLEISQTVQEADPERSKRHLSLAAQMLDRSREDLRRSIWNLRSNPLDNKSFLEALQQVAADRSIGSPIQICLESEGNPRSPGDLVAGNLILLTQEAITNALKHAQATRIGVKVVFEREAVSLTICDDGVGFDPQTVAGLREGHFGLQGMRERIKRLSGSIEIRSSVGQGTSVIATVPA